MCVFDMGFTLRIIEYLSEYESSMHSALSYKISLVILWFISFSAAIKTNNRSRVLFLLDVA